MPRRLSSLIATTILLAILVPGCRDEGILGHVVRFGKNGANGTLTVEVADTDEERERGLMGVTELAPDDGMAFVFDEPTETSFWMKDTLIPLSIAFVDADGTIVTIRDMDPCEAEPCETYASAEPYVLAVEANLGWFRDHGVDVGDVAGLGRIAAQ